MKERRQLLTGPTGPFWSEAQFAMLVLFKGVPLGGVSGETYLNDPRRWERRCWRLLLLGRWE